MTGLTRKLLAAVLACGTAGLLVPQPAAAGAIWTLSAIHDTINSLRDQGRQVIYDRLNQHYLQEVEASLKETQAELESVTTERTLLEAELTRQGQELAEAEKNLAELASREMQQEQQLAAARRATAAAYDEAAHIQQQAVHIQARIDAAQRVSSSYASSGVAGVVSGAMEEAYERALALIGYDENRIGEALAIARGMVTGEAEPVDAAAAEAAQAAAEAELEQAEAEFAAAMTRLDELNDIVAEGQAAETDYSETLRDHNEMITYRNELKQSLTESGEYLQELRDYEAELTKSLAEYNKEKAQLEKQLRPTEEAVYASSSLHFYDWHSDRGDKGHQLYSGLNMSLTHDVNTSWGLSLGRVNNSFDFDGFSDSAADFTDMSFDWARTNPHDKFTVIFRLAMSLPTGDSTKGSSQVPVITDLVEYDTFGSGRQIQPGLTIQRRIGREDMWIYNLSYVLRHGYTNTSGQQVEPGDGIGAQIGWQHIEEAWQLAAAYNFETLRGHSESGGQSYDDGDNREFRLTYNKKLDNDDQLAYFYWNIYDGGSKYLTPLDYEYDDSSQRRHYYGVDWQHSFDERRAAHILLSAMSAGGSSYDASLNTSQHAARRYGARLGYAFNIDERSQITFDVERFYLKDKVDGRSYRGNNAMLSYSRSF